jgi:DNA-binding MarR family transcriptional regulator
LLRLTAQGRAEFAEQARAHEEWIDGMLEGITSDEARQMAARLQQFAAAMEHEGAEHAQ